MHEHETMGRIDTTGKVQHFARNSPILELYVINVSPSQVGAALEAQFHAKNHVASSQEEFVPETQLAKAPIVATLHRRPML